MYETAAQYLHMEREFSQICTAAMLMTTQANGVDEEVINLIKHLCHSEQADERKNGAAMLFSMFKFLEEAASNKLGHLGMVAKSCNQTTNEVLKGALEDLMNDLSSVEASVATRLIHLDTVERIMLMHRSRFQAHGDSEKLRPVIKLLNESLMRFVSNKERETVVLLRMFYLIMDFISLHRSSKSEASMNPNTEIKSIMSDSTDDQEERDDGPCDQFLRGHLFVPYHLLRDVSISILHHIFVTLTKRTNRSEERDQSIANVRIVLLILIIEKCRNQSVLDSIGGMTFFASLLDDNIAAIAFHAAQYYMKQLSQVFPEQYFAYLEQLISKAQRSDNPLLLLNPYLQLRNIQQ